MRYQVVFVGSLLNAKGKPLPDDRAEKELDAVMEQLMKLAEDPSIGFKGDSGLVEISVSVEAKEVEKALEIGSGTIRTALHATGGFTPGWEIEWCDVRATRSEMVTT